MILRVRPQVAFLFTLLPGLLLGAPQDGPSVGFRHGVELRREVQLRHDVALRSGFLPLPEDLEATTAPDTRSIDSSRLPSPSLRIPPPLQALSPVAPGALAQAVENFSLQPAIYTPYDRYLGTVRQVISGVRGQGAPLAEACRLLRQAYSFRYAVRDPFQAELPTVTGANRSGDCKSKALWLYEQLGDSTSLYVIGKLEPAARSAHAWLYWRYDHEWWILDPTHRNTPIAVRSVEPGRYVPYYSYTRGGAFRHPATRLLRVASESGPTSPVADGIQPK